jgi:mono/diheme cytochrome c family protein
MKMKTMTMGCLGLLFAGSMLAADAAKGKGVFESNCSVCHNADSTEQKMGPGLKGLFKKDKLVTGKAPTEANVLEIINQGSPAGMPGFADSITAAEKSDLIAYLKSL